MSGSVRVPCSRPHPCPRSRPGSGYQGCNYVLPPLSLFRLLLGIHMYRVMQWPVMEVQGSIYLKLDKRVCSNIRRYLIKPCHMRFRIFEMIGQRSDAVQEPVTGYLLRKDHVKGAPASPMRTCWVKPCHLSSVKPSIFATSYLPPGYSPEYFYCVRIQPYGALYGHCGTSCGLAQDCGRRTRCPVKPDPSLALLQPYSKIDSRRS